MSLACLSNSPVAVITIPVNTGTENSTAPQQLAAETRMSAALRLIRPRRLDS
jgi:hypothetical protein